MRYRSSSAFTLIELLLVIGIIAILASIVIVALNPTKEMGGARDSQRRGDVSTILNAVLTYAVEHKGTLPATILTTPKEVCRTNMKPAACTTDNGIDLRMLSGAYLVTVPYDPLASATGTGTYYTIMRDSDGRVTVSAWATEQESLDISMTR